MTERNCLILTQYRTSSDYNDFIGKYYHFPANTNKNYLAQFDNLPLEFVYYEPEKHGKGEFFGYGVINKKPFEDKREDGYYFVEIDNYKKFSKPVYFKNDEGIILEKILNPDFYNYNNAVRKTTTQFIDEVSLDGGILLNFKADAHLVQVLGEQLIASERVGILELVKNAFDAGATLGISSYISDAQLQFLMSHTIKIIRLGLTNDNLGVDAPFLTDKFRKQIQKAASYMLDANAK